MTLMGGFVRIGNNRITVSINDVKKVSDIDPQEAQQTLETTKAKLRKTEGMRQIIEANIWAATSPLKLHFHFRFHFHIKALLSDLSLCTFSSLFNARPVVVFLSSLLTK